MTTVIVLDKGDEVFDWGFASLQKGKGFGFDELGVEFGKLIMKLSAESYGVLSFFLPLLDLYVCFLVI